MDIGVMVTHLPIVWGPHIACPHDIPMASLHHLDARQQPQERHVHGRAAPVMLFGK